MVWLLLQQNGTVQRLSYYPKVAVATATLPRGSPYHLDPWLELMSWLPVALIAIAQPLNKRSHLPGAMTCPHDRTLAYFLMMERIPCTKEKNIIC